MMKRLIVLFVFSICFTNALYSKARYLAKYSSYISENINGSFWEDSCNISNEFSGVLFNGNLKVSIIHEEITEELEKSIRNAKTAAGWAAVGAIVGSTKSALSFAKGNSVGVYSGAIDAEISSNASKSASKNAQELQHLDAYVFLENNSDEEIVVNLLDKGLLWFLQPNTYLCLNLGNPGCATFRISKANMAEQPISIINAVASSQTKRIESIFEDANYIYCDLKRNVYDAYETQATAYRRIDKMTLEETEISADEFKVIKKGK